MAKRLFIYALGLLCCVGLALGDCAGVIFFEPWATWNLAVWTYDGNLGEAPIRQAFEAWHSRNNSIEFCRYPDCSEYVDIFISDDYSITTPAEEASVSHSQGPCYNRPSVQCPNLCFNYHKTYYATIKINPTRIAQIASQPYGMTFDDVVKAFISHEIGHFYRLGNIDSPANCSFPSVMSVNDIFQCSPRTITAQACDGSTAATIIANHPVANFSQCNVWCSLHSNCQ